MAEMQQKRLNLIKRTIVQHKFMRKATYIEGPEE